MQHKAVLLVEEKREREEDVCCEGVVVIAPDSQEEWMHRITDLLDRFDWFMDCRNQYVYVSTFVLAVEKV